MSKDDEVYSAQELADAGMQIKATVPEANAWPFPDEQSPYLKRLGKIANEAADKLHKEGYTLLEAETSSSDLGTLRFIDLNLMDVFEFIDDEERTVQALKVGNSTAIIGFTLTKKFNILNEPSISNERLAKDDIGKIRLKGSKQVRRILPQHGSDARNKNWFEPSPSSGDAEDHS